MRRVRLRKRRLETEQGEVAYDYLVIATGVSHSIQMGEAAADNVLRDLRGEPRLPFRYRHKGSLATIGRAAAVAQIGRFRFAGLLAWLLWLFVHILFLVGFRNRVAVLLQWAWSYATFKRGARLITRTAAVEPPGTAASRGARG